MSNPDQFFEPVAPPRASTPGKTIALVWMVIACLYGVWFLYDGFVAWPAENARWQTMTQRMHELQLQADGLGHNTAEYAALMASSKKSHRHTDFDVTLQRALGPTMILAGVMPLGIILLVARLGRTSETRRMQ